MKHLSIINLCLPQRLISAIMENLMENSRRLFVEGSRAMLTAARPRCSTLLVALMNALWVPYWKVITDKTLLIARRDGGASQQRTSLTRWRATWNDLQRMWSWFSPPESFFQFTCSPDMSNCCRDLRWEKSPELKITHLNFMLFRLQMDRNTDDSLDREIRRDSPPVESNSKRCFMFLNFISQFLDTSTVMMLINHSLISHRRLVKLEIEQLVMSHHWN